MPWEVWADLRRRHGGGCTLGFVGTHQSSNRKLLSTPRPSSNSNNYSARHPPPIPSEPPCNVQTTSSTRGGTHPHGPHCLQARPRQAQTYQITPWWAAGASKPPRKHATAIGVFKWPVASTHPTKHSLNHRRDYMPPAPSRSPRTPELPTST